MKIFNIKPIKVNEYVFNQEYLSDGESGSLYQSSFDYEFSIDLTDTFIIIFDLRYIAENNFKDTISPLDSRNEFTVEVQSEFGDGKVILAYNYSCQFNFKNEGFDADVLSLHQFLTEFYAHMTSILEQDRFEKLKEKEREMRKNHPLQETVLEIIDNLRANKMYEF